MSRLAVLVATCGYIGHAPIAPGTFGSAAGVVLFYALRSSQSQAVEFAAILLLFAIGVWSAQVTERSLGVTDPGVVVIDEVVGMLITLALLPLNGLGVGIAFLVFRVLDVIKPWPASRFEGLHGGLGIVADDAMAGVYGNLIMRGLLLLAPAWLV
jgi:phosphatidylglycerophosphatase A